MAAVLQTFAIFVCITDRSNRCLSIYSSGLRISMSRCWKQVLV